MPSDKEVDEILGETSAVEKKPVSDEAYKDAVSEGTIDYKKQYEEIRKLEAKREAELHELREYKKATSVEADIEDDKPKVLTEADIQKQIDEGIARIEKARALQSNLQAAVSKYPFVDEADTLNFIKEKGGRLTVQEAISLKYGQELRAYEAANRGEEIPTTDTGGRTLATKPAESDDHGDLKQGFRIGRHDADAFQRFISKRMTENLKKATGQR